MRGYLSPLLAVVVVCLVAATPLEAETPSERLFAQRWADHLPAWCLHTAMLPDGTYSGLYSGPQSLEYKKYYGPIWTSMHHYCFGLAATFEASSLEDKDLRNSKYSQAVYEYNYVLDRAPDSFRLKSEILVQKGTALDMLGDLNGAVDAYTEAIRLNTNEVSAYLGLSSCFEALEDPDGALAIIEAGLRYVPESEALLEKRQQLTTMVGSRR